MQSWQERLDKHYAGVRTGRPFDRPIFALEHGLSDADLQILKGVVKSAAKQRKFSSSHHLPWVVYASEVGYQFAGDQYWQTFEATTPGWRESGDSDWMRKRDWVRNCFLQFQENFNGAKPIGPWAAHRSIICWPITHAVLPNDLQRQLAQLLYELRSSFRPEHFESPILLGQHLAAYSSSASSRFQSLAEAPALLGQIAAALLFQDRDYAASLLLPSTLRRIAADLDRESRSRGWLQGAKTRAQSIQFSGLRRDEIEKPRPSGEPEHRQRTAALGVEPQVVLRPDDVDTWSIWLDIPSLRPLQVKFPEFAPTLSGSRCAVAGSGLRSPLPRGQLLSGYLVPLAKWPKQNEPLLTFDDAPKTLQQLLNDECFLRSGPIWLFRINAGGLAHEIIGKTARPNQKYVLLSDGDIADFGAFGHAVSISCDGLYGWALDIPSFVPKELEQFLRKLGISVSIGIDAWPAGVPAAAWDQEGAAEWTYPHTPRIGIHLDHAVEQLRLDLDAPDNQPIELSVKGDANYFIELPGLRPGNYSLQVKASYGEHGRAPAAGVMRIAIREPGLGLSTSTRAPIRVFSDPLQPTLEQLWQEECRFEVIGPRDRMITCQIEFLERDQTQALTSKTMSALQMPVTADQWISSFNRQVRSNTAVQTAYDKAYSARVIFDAGELGRSVFVLEREFTPLRWTVERKRAGYKLELIDDSGEQNGAKVQHYSFTEPDKSQNVPINSASWDASDKGGLYLAVVGSSSRGIILPPAQLTNLKDLKMKTRMSFQSRSADNVLSLITTLEAWLEARVPGSAVAAHRRQQVVTELTSYLFYVVCGQRWKSGELSREPDWKRRVGILQSAAKEAFPPLRTTVDTMPGGAKDWLSVPLEKRAAKLSWLLQTKGALTVRRDGKLPVNTKSNSNVSPLFVDAAWFCEFCLRLASAPATLRRWAGPDLRAGMNMLLSYRSVACAARLIVLSSSEINNDLEEGGVLFKGWDWE